MGLLNWEPSAKTPRSFRPPSEADVRRRRSLVAAQNEVRFQREQNAMDQQLQIQLGQARRELAVERSRSLRINSMGGGLGAGLPLLTRGGVPMPHTYGASGGHLAALDLHNRQLRLAEQQRIAADQSNRLRYAAQQERADLERRQRAAHAREVARHTQEQRLRQEQQDAALRRASEDLRRRELAIRERDAAEARKKAELEREERHRREAALRRRSEQLEAREFRMSMERLSVREAQIAQDEYLLEEQRRATLYSPRAAGHSRSRSDLPYHPQAAAHYGGMPDLPPNLASPAPFVDRFAHGRPMPRRDETIRPGDPLGDGYAAAFPSAAAPMRAPTPSPRNVHFDPRAAVPGSAPAAYGDDFKADPYYRDEPLFPSSASEAGYPSPHDASSGARSRHSSAASHAASLFPDPRSRHGSLHSGHGSATRLTDLYSPARSARLDSFGSSVDPALSLSRSHSRHPSGAVDGADLVADAFRSPRFGPTGRSPLMDSSPGSAGYRSRRPSEAAI